MKKTDIVHTSNNGERVTSLYAENYLNDDHCGHKKLISEKTKTNKTQPIEYEKPIDTWVSPSDLLIGILDLKPPFTSKITRGKTHEGILAIGESILDQERETFLKYIDKLLNDNDAAWNHILEHEKSQVAKKVQATYQDILTTKSKTLMKEINQFYENSLQELEDHLRTEVQTVLISAHANIVSDLNREIKENLKKEGLILDDVLKKRYDSEITKIKHYYKLLLDNEIYRNNKLVNQAIYERNDALKAFYTQVDAQNITSTMYMMSTERKKCRIRQFILENIQSTELAEKHKKVKERQDVIDSFKKREKRISDINKEWEDKIKKVLQLFLKFVSFSLKLLPEQATFLFDLEKMVVLQLNEIKKTPKKTASILVCKEDDNILKFIEPDPKQVICDKEPFVVEGDLLDTIPPKYDSGEIQASDVDLPYVRLQRKFIYAQCGRMEEVKQFLESQRCKCMESSPEPPSPSISIESTAIKETKSPSVIEIESSNETLVMEDVHILKDCPIRRCKDFAKRYSFPYLPSYFDFTEENYTTVKGILGKPPTMDVTPDLIDPEIMTTQELHFSATKEPYHNVGTQYSSQEDIITDLKCPCMENVSEHDMHESNTKVKESKSKELDEILLKRKASLQRVINQHPKLLKMFTDESFDFIYTIK